MINNLYLFAITALILFLTGCNDELNELTKKTITIPEPGEKTIVFQTNEGRLGWHISSASFDYEIHTRLSPGFFDIEPEWSRDKKWIIFTRGIYPDSNLRIWKMRYNGEDKIVLTATHLNCEGAKFSPDGKRVAFFVRTDVRGIIYTMDVFGNNWKQITDSSTIPFYNSASFAYPDWAPDGKKIIFSYVTLNPYKSGLAIINLETREFTKLAAADHLNPYDPTWSPNSEQIVFIGGIPDSTGPKIFKINADGNGLIMLTNSWGSSAPDWSSDGSMIAYANIDSLGGRSSIWVMDNDGSNKRKLIEIPNRDATEPTW